MSILKITAILLLLFFMISKIMDLPGYISAILAFGWMCFVPFCLGTLFTKLPIKSVEKLSIRLHDIKFVSFPFLWSIGFLITISITYLSLAGHLNFVGWIGPILFFVAMISYIMLNNKQRIRLTGKALTILVIGLMLGIIFGGYLHSFSPYPLSPGVDTFIHFYVVKNILNNSIYAPLHYPQTFDMLIALATDTFKADLTEVFWIGSFMLFPLFSLSMYIMSYWFTKNHILALVGSVIGLCITEQGFVVNLQFFYPASFVMTVFPLVLFLVDFIWSRSNTNKTLALFVTAIILLVLILIHLELGSVAIGIIISFLVISRKVEKNDLYNFLAKITTIYLVIVLFMYFTGHLTSQIRLEGFTDVVNSVTYHYDTLDKNEAIKSWYTSEILTLSLLGLIALAFYRERKVMVLSLLGSIVLFLYYQDINFIHRIMTLERPLLAFAAAALVIIPINLFESYIIKHLKSPLKKIKQLAQGFKKANPHHLDENYSIPKSMQNFSISHAQSRKSTYGEILDRFTSKSRLTKLNILYAFVFIVLLFPTVVKPYDTYLEPYFKRDLPFASFTNEELTAARWVEKNTPNNYLLYSDLFTVIEFRGLTHRENVPAIGWNQTIIQEVRSAMTSESASDAYHNIVSNVGENTLIVITARTPVWLDSNELVSFPEKKFETFTGFDKFFDEKYFKLEYHSENIFIFSPKHGQA